MTLTLLKVRRSSRQLWSRSVIKLSAVLLALVLLLIPGYQLVSAAQTPAPQLLKSLRQRQQKVDRYRTGVSQQRQQLQQVEGAAQTRLKGLRQTVQATAAQIADNQGQIEAAVQQLRRLEAELATAQSAYNQKQSAAAARLRFLQRRHTANGWAALLQSKTLEEFLDRRYQLKLVYQADQQALAGLKLEADNLDTQKRQVELTKNHIALLTQQLLSQKAAYEAQAQAQTQLITRLNTDRQALEAAEVQLATDSQNLGLLIQQRVQRPNPHNIVAFGTGRFSYPSPSLITSSFGWRVHPVLGYSRFHSGVDFGAAYGSPIRAADRGAVIFAGWYGGYGNAVVIDHGNGITTLYGHSSQLYVAAGQVVQRGQAIAAVGSTGLSTGPHLHFEVRLNGTPVDPIAYL